VIEMSKRVAASNVKRAAAFTETDLKICDLCGRLNLAEAKECFVCAWRGRFETDPELVRIAIEMTVQRFGPIEPHQVSAHPSPAESEDEPSPLFRFGAWLRRLFGMR